MRSAAAAGGSSGPASGRSLAANVAVLMTSQVATTALGAATAVLLPIYLGDVKLGRLAFAESACLILGTLVVLGTNVYIVREVAADRSRLPSLVTASLAARPVLWLLMAAVMLALLALRRTAADVIVMAAVLSVVTLVSVLNGVLAAALVGLEEMRRRSAAAVADAAVVFAIGVPVVIVTRSPLAFILVMLLGALVDLCLNALWFRGRGPGLYLPRRATYRALALGALPLMALAVLQGVYGQLDTVMTALLSDDATVGWFAAANRFSVAVMLIPVVMSSALLPAMSRLLSDQTEREAAFAAFRNLLRVVLLLALPTAVGLAAIAPRLFWFLHYPPAFQHSVPVLVLLAFSWVLTAVAMLMFTGIVAAGRQRAWGIVSAAMIGLLVLLDLICIPAARHWLGNGAVGAAAASLLAEAAVVAAGLWLLPAGLGWRDAWYLFRVAGACGAMSLAVEWQLRQLPLPVVVALGAGLYVAASFVLRTLTLDQISQVSSLIGRRGGRWSAPQPEAAPALL